MGIYEELEDISLLWPHKDHAYFDTGEKLNSYTAADLGIDELVRQFSIHKQYEKTVKHVFMNMCRYTKVLEYRFDVVEDLLANPLLTEVFEEILPLARELGEYKSSMGGTDQVPLLQTVRKLGEMEIFMKCVTKLSEALNKEGCSLKSAALVKLAGLLGKVKEDEQFRALTQRLPEMRSGFERLASVTIGINLDEQLRPVEAVVLSINDRKFKGEPFLDRLFGKKQGSDEYTGISQLHSILAPCVRSEMDKVREASRDSMSVALQVTLFNDLHRILNRVIDPVSSAISKYARLNGAFLVSLEPEIAFFIGAVKLIKRIQAAGLGMCRPVIAAEDERVFNVKENYNIGLALRRLADNGSADLKDMVVANDVSLDANGRIYILTGPNQGGKTTYIQAIALTQVLMQSGIFVPGERALMSTADSIFTHFPVEEKPSADAGRLGEEAKRLSEIFNNATSHSLVILNESLASTSPGESLYMSRDIVRGLKLLGARSIFATHLHDLAAGIEDLNREIPGDSPIISVVAGVSGEGGIDGITRRTYKVVPAPPQGISYARDIATRYGISFEQISRAIAAHKAGQSKYEAGRSAPVE